MSKLIKGINDLDSWCKKYNREYLLHEWDYNKNYPLAPENIAYGNSRQKVWWRCGKCGYSWCTTVNNRTNGFNGCPVCANKVIVSGVNDLQTLYPNVARRWHPAMNIKKPSEVSAHSQQYAWWLCDKDERHYFRSRIDHVVDDKVVCPVCAGQQIIIGVNDLATTHPQLVTEWDYEKNADLLPTNVTAGTPRKVWWKCGKGHSWSACVSSRTGKEKCGCPYCTQEHRISKQEKTISFYLSKYFTVVDNIKFDWLGTMELDMYLPELSLAIEYDGKHWHGDTNRDLAKDNLCNEHGIRLLRLRENGCLHYETSAMLIETRSVPKTVESLQEMLTQAFEYINVQYNKDLPTQFDVAKDNNLILSSIRTIKKNNCVANSKLINEWDFDKNVGVNPECISLGSSEKIWWKCHKGHSWQAAVYSRSGKNPCGCPYCAGQKVLQGENDLLTLYPDLAKEWNYEKNGDLLPQHFLPNSNIKVWWKCSKCGYEWQTATGDRIRGRGCYVCRKQVGGNRKKTLNIDTGVIYKDAQTAGNILHINADSIRNCCRGLSHTAGGYHWKYIGKDKKQ